VPLNAWVIRFWNKKKKRTNHIVLVTTDVKVRASWIVRHYEERPEIAQDYQRMKGGAGSATRSAPLVTVRLFFIS
jgi:hypothetical protein